jgi:hypothetical protein
MSNVVLKELTKVPSAFQVLLYPVRFSLPSASQVMLYPVRFSFVVIGGLQSSRSVEVSIGIKLTSDGGGRKSIKVETVSN